MNTRQRVGNMLAYGILYYTICLLPLIVTCRHVHLKVTPSKSFSGRGFHTEMVDRLLDCVYRCVGVKRCHSLSFNETSSVCNLYPSFHNLDIEIGSELLCASLDNTFENDQISPKTVAKSPLRVNANQSMDKSETVFDLVVRKQHNITWKRAEAECNLGLVTIDSEEKQAMAVKKAKASGLDLIAIGVFMDKLEWYYGNHRKVKYSAWNSGRHFGLYGAMARKHNYKWVSIVSKVDGFICDVKWTNH